MKVRALQSCYINATYRKGPEYNDKEELTVTGEVFDVPDDFVINPEVLEVVSAPEGVKVKYDKPGVAGARK